MVECRVCMASGNGKGIFHGTLRNVEKHFGVGRQKGKANVGILHRRYYVYSFDYQTQYFIALFKISNRNAKKQTGVHNFLNKIYIGSDKVRERRVDETIISYSITDGLHLWRIFIGTTSPTTLLQEGHRIKHQCSFCQKTRKAYS